MKVIAELSELKVSVFPLVPPVVEYGFEVKVVPDVTPSDVGPRMVIPALTMMVSVEVTLTLSESVTVMVSTRFVASVVESTVTTP